jgi:antirestriction protein ArdC
LRGRFGSESYAAEELIAELGSAFLAAELQLESEPRTDHAPYVANWLQVLKNDKRAIFTAAGKAQQAVDWLLRQNAKEQAAEAASYSGYFSSDVSGSLSSRTRTNLECRR